MKFVATTLASLILLVRGESQIAGEGPAGAPRDLEYNEYDEHLPVPIPPAPGSDAVLPVAFWEHYRRQEEREEREEELRLSSSPPLLRHATTGSLHGLVLLVRFKGHGPEDVPKKEDIETLFNSDIGVDVTKPMEKQEGNEVNPTGSVHEMYVANSHGALQISATVTEWIPLDHDEKYYASDNEDVGQSGLSKSRFRDGIREALEKLAADPAAYAPEGFDLANFDYSDGQLDGFGVLHSGHGAEYGGDDQKFRIWSHKSSGLKWTVPESLLSAGEGVRLRGKTREERKVNKFYTAAALHGKEGKGMLRFGVLCHEIGHSLQLPDLYDTGFKGKGIGKYDVMANGNYGFDNTGYFPSNMSAWTKVFLGWVQAVEIVADGTYTLEAASDGDHQIYKIAHKFPEGEYLLLENRQPVGYDSPMEGGGIAIWHIDDNVRKQKFPGFPNMDPVDGADFPQNGQHYKVALLASDGAYGLEKGETEGTGGDLLWHEDSELKDLGTSGTFPDTETYSGGNVEITGVRIYDFSASGMSMTFKVEGIDAAREGRTGLRDSTSIRVAK